MTRHMNLPTNTQENHKMYTSIEWTETAYFDAVMEYLKDNNIKSFMDIGGCTGEVSNIILDKISNIEYGLVFEPYPDNYEYILENVNLNKIQVENKAVFYGKDSITLSNRQNNVGSWSFLFSEDYPDTSLEVQCVDLDVYLGEKIYDFVKIDIEGAEYNVIENSKLLKEVKFIELELHHEHFEIYGEQNPERNIKKYKYAIDFVLDHLPNHEMCYFLCGSDIESEEVNPGNVFLIKK